MRCVVMLASTLSVAVLLGGCQASAPVKPSGDALVTAIRAAGQRNQSVVHVEPLRKPGVTRLLARVRADVVARQFQRAADTLDEALVLSPDAPDLLQYRAELAVQLGHYGQAESLARESFSLGPKLGGLCARNWQTVVEMRQLVHDPSGVASARQSLAACARERPVHH